MLFQRELWSITSSPQSIISLRFMQHFLFFFLPVAMCASLPMIIPPPRHPPPVLSTLFGVLLCQWVSKEIPLTELIKQQQRRFKGSMVYWSLMIPWNGPEGWPDLGSSEGGALTRGLQLGKATPGGCGLSKQGPHYNAFILSVAPSPIWQSSCPLLLCFLFCFVFYHRKQLSQYA